MKKLLVLAALSAMAFGAQAEYLNFTLDLSGAKAVYAAIPCYLEHTKEDVAGYWAEIRPGFFDEGVRDAEFGVETWTEAYAMVEGMYADAEMKFSDKGGGNFALEIDENGWGGIQNWGILALTDATEFSPGAAYSIYYGTSVNKEGSEITLDLTPIETGFLMTDSPASAPEPTSGLLLLLGVAGLALKRKRA